MTSTFCNCAVDNNKHTNCAVDNSKHTNRVVDNSKHTNRAVDNSKYTNRVVDNSKHTNRAVDNSKHTNFPIQAHLFQLNFTLSFFLPNYHAERKDVLYTPHLSDARYARSPFPSSFVSDFYLPPNITITKYIRQKQIWAKNFNSMTDENSRQQSL
jgi:hypothetical protein